MASWCCPHVSSGEVQPSVYVRMRYGRMAARCPTGSARVPPCTSCCLPSAKTEMVATRARPLWRSFRSGDVSPRVRRSISAFGYIAR